MKYLSLQNFKINAGLIGLKCTSGSQSNELFSVTFSRLLLLFFELHIRNPPIES